MDLVEESRGEGCTIDCLGRTREGDAGGGGGRGRGRGRGRVDRQQPDSSSDCPIESPSSGSAGLSWLLSQAMPVLVMS